MPKELLLLIGVASLLLAVWWIVTARVAPVTMPALLWIPTAIFLVYGLLLVAAGVSDWVRDEALPAAALAGIGIGLLADGLNAAYERRPFTFAALKEMRPPALAKMSPRRVRGDLAWVEQHARDLPIHQVGHDYYIAGPPEEVEYYKSHGRWPDDRAWVREDTSIARTARTALPWPLRTAVGLCIGGIILASLIPSPVRRDAEELRHDGAGELAIVVATIGGAIVLLQVLRGREGLKLVLQYVVAFAVAGLLAWILGWDLPIYE
jgi:hypothetical protein